MKLSLRTLSVALITSLTALVLGCSEAPPEEDVGESDDALRTTYGDLIETLEGPDLDRWLAARAELREGLARSCAEGDALCSGDYTNVMSVRLACSSTRIARKMKDCVWVLGASVEHVDVSSGELTSDMHVWTCHVPVSGRATGMLAALEGGGAGALHAILPGTGKSFHDALVACLDGTTARPLPAATTGSFVELGADLCASADGPGAAWTNTKRRLNDGFDAACGDSFCEGDYPDVAGLGFSCSVDRTTARVAGCSWSFAAAATAVDSRGHMTAGTKTTRCGVAIDAPAGALTSALAGDDPLHAPLPGRTTSIYDALIGCL